MVGVVSDVICDDAEEGNSDCDDFIDLVGEFVGTNGDCATTGDLDDGTGKFGLGVDSDVICEAAEGDTSDCGDVMDLVGELAWKIGEGATIGDSDNGMDAVGVCPGLSGVSPGMYEVGAAGDDGLDSVGDKGKTSVGFRAASIVTFKLNRSRMSGTVGLWVLPTLPFAAMVGGPMIVGDVGTLSGIDMLTTGSDGDVVFILDDEGIGEPPGVEAATVGALVTALEPNKGTVDADVGLSIDGVGNGIAGMVTGRDGDIVFILVDVGISEPPGVEFATVWAIVTGVEPSKGIVDGEVGFGVDGVVIGIDGVVVFTLVDEGINEPPGSEVATVGGVVVMVRSGKGTGAVEEGGNTIVVPLPAVDGEETCGT
jgi:hypothetical protein